MSELMDEDLAELVAEVWLSRQCDIQLLAADMRWTIAQTKEALDHPMVRRHCHRLAVRLMRSRRQNAGLILAELQRRLEDAPDAQMALEIARTMAGIAQTLEPPAEQAQAAQAPTINYIRDADDSEAIYPIEED